MKIIDNKPYNVAQRLAKTSLHGVIYMKYNRLAGVGPLHNVKRVFWDQLNISLNIIELWVGTHIAYLELDGTKDPSVILS